MSWLAAEEPEARRPLACGALEAVIVPRPRDLGGFEVRRVLPSAERRSVGPFVFFDQMGPAELAPGSSIDVRPHPHIGLATVTYLFDGTIVHRDSLGSVQSIEPGAPRYLWWNFVSSSWERIEQAKGGRFAPVAGDREFIPLPE
jgi:redox-sensitive bicupin YhaK (pirin superfamily)